MTTSVDRARPFYLAASAAVVLATSFGAGRVLTINNASTQAFEENPVAGVTVPSLPPIDEFAAPADVTTTTAPVASSSATTAAPETTGTTTPSVVNAVCQWSAKILAGGIPGPLPYGEADRFAVTVTNPAWAGLPVSIDRTFAVPAGRRPVSQQPPTTIVADEAGTVTFVIPIGPESQGGAISVLTQAVTSELPDDICDWHEFAVDYDGPQGLVGGILASAATNLLNLNL